VLDAEGELAAHRSAKADEIAMSVPVPSSPPLPR
jgi:hypothetical protein